MSDTPAILLAVDGEPVTAAIPNTKLKFVVNTQWPLFLDTSKSYYLLAGQRWLTATDLHGPWTVAAKLPKDMAEILAAFSENVPNWKCLLNDSECDSEHPCAFHKPLNAFQNRLERITISDLNKPVSAKR